MLKEKAALFTIGQFAALHEINKKTLMWYDEIGLLKPACIKENGCGTGNNFNAAGVKCIS